MSTPRFNLRNASLFLTKLKTKYNNNKSEQNRDNTFIDEEQQNSSSNPSIRKKHSEKLDSVTDRLFANHDEEDIMRQKSSVGQSAQKKQQSNSQNIRQTYQTTQQSQAKQHQAQFCDLIVIKYLQQTLAIYKADLQTLEHNRENLQQEIYFLGRKISKLHELSSQNIKLQRQINELNHQLRETIARYHQSNRTLWRQKMQMSKVFNRERNKIKKLLLLVGKQDCQNRVENYFKLDSFGDSYVGKYLEFMSFKNEQQRQINNRLFMEMGNNPVLMQENAKLLEDVFKGKEQIYFRDRKKPVQSQLKSQPLLPAAQIIEKKKQKKVVLYDESQHEAASLQPEKEKPKKLSQSQRAMLLGDLKNFSKSFKLPNNK